MYCSCICCGFELFEHLFCVKKVLIKTGLFIYLFFGSGRVDVLAFHVIFRGHLCNAPVQMGRHFHQSVTPLQSVMVVNNIITL